jgi:MmyB-like transcription regulator ligand binding domain
MISPPCSCRGSRCPQFAKLWAEHDVASPVTYLKVFQHPAFPRLTMTSTSLGMLSVPGTRLVVYTPADEECRTAIGRLLAGEGRDARYPCWPEHERRRAELAAPAAAAG